MTDKTLHNSTVSEDIMAEVDQSAGPPEGCSPIGPLLLALNNDSDYRHGWDANLTMTCFDAIMTDESARSMGHESARRVAVASAKRFLDILTA